MILYNVTLKSDKRQLGGTVDYHGASLSNMKQIFFCSGFAK